ncbi:GNAT family N-acetyltransferase [Bacillus salacetis]|uniref:GNAT family N-acetyltransferase n=1 Tax=Bacillus salacetis TaxID=2315464 RepID=A0A3A1QV63_9BACI|nr:GNAT family N-acetyltransferase [Bacillus salacetis]
MILKDELHIRLMNWDDIDLMVKWLNDSNVLEFYEEPPSTKQRVIKKYGPRIDGHHYVVPCIVEYSRQPIGYIQYYKVPQSELKRYGLDEDHYFGIDQFIGDTRLWGKGIGTRMIQMMLQYLLERGASKVVLEVKKVNERAISSYKKCRFEKVSDLDYESDLMVWAAPVNSLIKD